MQCWTNVEDVGPTLYKCYTNVLCLCHILYFVGQRENGSMVLSNGLHSGLVMDRSIAWLDRFENTGADAGWRKTSRRSVEHFDSKT